MRLLVFMIFLLVPVLESAAQNVRPDIIPYPKEVAGGTGSFEFNAQTIVVVQGPCMQEVKLFVERLSFITGHAFPIEEGGEIPTTNYILFSGGKDMNSPKDQVPNLPGNLNSYLENRDPGAYKIFVDSSRVLVSATYSAGIFYATQTLLQLLPGSSEKGSLSLPLLIPALRINDKPQFVHRGFMLDCCRHFIPLDVIRKYIDVLAYYKMNTLHWHLTEDQGWRIEILKYPKLTETGAWRINPDGTRYGGYYTQDEIRSLVRYASDRHITIIPEIELPGHSVAAIASYPFLGCTHEKIPVENQWGVFKDIYCAGNDSTFAFLEDVLNEVCALFPGPFIHIGGDEVPKFRWEHCARCQKRISDEGLKDESELQSWFIERIATFLHTKGKRIIGWDEILEGGIPADATIQSWRGMQGGLDAAKAGHSAVMSPTSHCYLDYGLETTDMKVVYSFNPIPDGLNATETARIRGGEGNMWTEHAPPELLDSKVFPRLIALAEVLWTYPEQRNYSEFQQRMASHYPRLKAMNINFGFPEVPVTFQVSKGNNGEMIVALNISDENYSVSYRERPIGNENSESSQNYVPYKTPLTIHKPTVFEVLAEMDGMVYNSSLSRSFDPHLGYQKVLTLNYIPSPHYSGGGVNALVDGRLGTGAFRDGVWQAVQGKDIEAVVDLGKMTEVSSLSTSWFHYGNAWIFGPEQVSYYVSKNGVDWELFGSVKGTTDEKTPGEFIVPYNLINSDGARSARYIKMIAVNSGPCPEWHDAPGEPTWLFCDELIIH